MGRTPAKVLPNEEIRPPKPVEVPAANYEPRTEWALELATPGNNEKALAAIEACCRKYPRSGAAQRTRGDILAIQIGPEAGKGFVCLSACSQQETIRRAEAALEAFELAIKLSNEDAKAYMSRGNVRYMLGDLNGAIADLDKALECCRSVPSLENATLFPVIQQMRSEAHAHSEQPIH